MKKFIYYRDIFAYLVGAGLAVPDGVRVAPFAFVVEPTDNLEGRDGVEVVTRRVGIRVCVPSSSRKCFVISLHKSSQ